ncbi:transferase hexapeptide (six repeat-containing protein) [Oceanospirillum multiglobuliferum]|uniref:Acetyltransferase n=1 Tax=Oceanospirillum multiglobuliferum TaxID=64969 RepID=A0A1T4PDU7_9GAMM|nr:acyltransferase [Oceanospirillum multiglobuliferum]OPX55591.1 acetyltransferase [Oceanospirillum multiglobuliferum]SJZ89720.1 transferase hexapeptide (six repeat-containing protein) [Oceanospirillum multiglobuliferum]
MTQTSLMLQMKGWAKTSPNPIAKFIRNNWKQLNRIELPVIPVLHPLLFQVHRSISQLSHTLVSRLYWLPLFKSQIKGGKRLYLYSGMPQILAPLQIQIGDDCRISGVSTFSGRWFSQKTPELIVGNNVDIGWQTTIAVADQVILEDNVRMAGKAFLAGYPGHPVDPIARAEGKPDLDSQTGTIHLKQNVWLGTGVTVLAGVTIGENSIIGSGSVVTKDIPANVIAAGNPAKVVRHLL